MVKHLPALPVVPWLHCGQLREHGHRRRVAQVDGIGVAPFCGKEGGVSMAKTWENHGKNVLLGGLDIWVWVNTYRYISSGMNIHLPAILGFTRYQGFDPSPYI